jgi:hypothetical protein
MNGEEEKEGEFGVGAGAGAPAAAAAALLNEKEDGVAEADRIVGKKWRAQGERRKRL